MTTHPYPTAPIVLPKLGSWPASVHVFEEESAYALAAAEAANRPLLIRGEPGTGKSQLARAAAVASKRLFLAAVIHARSEGQDLQWHFDAVGRLGEAQAFGQAALAEDTQTRLHPRRFLSPGPLWWALDWHSAQAQWHACSSPPAPVPERPPQWQPRHGSVLLLDEMDKADSDVPNSLLETLGNNDFSVPYLGITVRQSDDCPPPLVIITTNEERELPAAFVRRCLVLTLHMPKDDEALLDFLCRRGDIHFQNRCPAAVRRQAAELLLEDRKAAQAQGLPPPGQAEYLDLLRAVCHMASSAEEQLALLDKISRFVLQKFPPLGG